MEEISSKIRNKKRLMFISGEDFYLMAYSVIIILNELGCFNGKKVFKDHRKLSYLIPFISDGKYKSIWTKLDVRNSEASSVLSVEERKLLLDTYYGAIGKDLIIERLLSTMDRHGILTIETSGNRRAFDISLNRHVGVEKILQCDLYNYERGNFKFMIKKVKRLNVLTFESFVEKIFHEFEIGRCLV